MSEKHTTQDLVFWLGCRKTNNSAHNFVIDAIIARLRAADALCEAAREHAKHDEEWTCDIMLKAIAEFKEA